MAIVSTRHDGREQTHHLLFDLGIDRSRPSHMIPDGALWEARNVYYPKNSGIPRTRGGLVQYQGDETPGDATKITGVYVYQKNASTEYVVFSRIDTAGTAQELFYLDGSLEEQLIGALPTTNYPSFETHGGMLHIAVGGGNSIYIWQGLTGGSPVAATGTITFAGQPSATETITIGNNTWTFQAARTQAFEVGIGGSASATLDNLVAAINYDAYDVKATDADPDVTITATLIGTAGNSIGLSEAATNITVGAANLASGANGAALDELSTYGHPHPEFLMSDKNRRLVTGGDTNYPDTLAFSAPANSLTFSSGGGGVFAEDHGGETFLVGAEEGNRLKAAAVFRNEIEVHKGGANKEIHRVLIGNPDAASWSITRRFHEGTSAAMNHRCALSVGNVHLAYDEKSYMRFYGIEAHDELRGDLVGDRVGDFLSGTSTTHGFLAVNPKEKYVLAFPTVGRSCMVYHYDEYIDSEGRKHFGRWTNWQFMERDVSCAVYSETLGTMLFGCDDGLIYKLDPDTFTDDGTAYQTIVRCKTLGAFDVYVAALKQAILDYENLSSGSGVLAFIKNKLEDGGDTAEDFTTSDNAMFLVDATDDLADATYDFSSESFGRVNTFEDLQGETLAAEIRLSSGGIAFNHIIIQLAITGRDYVTQ